MKSTKSPLSLRLLLLVLACILSMSACKHASPKRELPQLKPETPEVRCKKGPGPLVPVEPKADEWIEWNPPRPGKTEGEARLSEKAVNFIIDLYTWGTTVEGLRNVEHKCLDEHEAKGLIRQ